MGCLFLGMTKALSSLAFLIFLLVFQDLPQEGLKDKFKDDFFLGTAVNLAQVTGKEPGADSLLNLHFNSITAENGLKWGPVHPNPGEYRFEFGDAFVALGERMGAFMVGHTLVWHQQTPAWVFKNEEGQLLSGKELTLRMEDHIEQVVGRYKGRIDGWDVVNEAFLDDGSLRPSIWSKNIPDYIAKSFQWAV